MVCVILHNIPVTKRVALLDEVHPQEDGMGNNELLGDGVNQAVDDTQVRDAVIQRWF